MTPSDKLTMLTESFAGNLPTKLQVEDSIDPYWGTVVELDSEVVVMEYYNCLESILIENIELIWN